MLEVIGLKKHFGSTTALQDASFRCEPGKVLALLGENGAGKSTLVGIIAGVVRPDAGSVTVDGRPLRFGSPRAAQSAGIGVAFQELSLIPTMTVAQNLFLAHEPRNSLGLVRARELRASVRDLLGDAGLSDLDLDARVETLPLSVQQKLEIARAVVRGKRVCLLDEPTSALAAGDVAWFESVVQRLRDTGRAVVFISHRLPEIRRFCDTVTVVRQGRSEMTWPVDEVSDDELVTATLGRQLEMVYPERRPPEHPSGNERPLLHLRDFSTRDGSVQVSLDIHAGEVVGVAALQGHGQDQLLRGLFGDVASKAGALEVGGHRKKIASPRAAMAPAVNMGFVPENRRTEGLLIELPAERNVTLTDLKRSSTLGVMRPRREREITAGILDRLRATRILPWEPVSRLSGGNQQKLVIGKWLARGSRLLLLYDPTRGVDVGTKADIYDLLRDHAAGGGGVFWYSTDLEELANVCDRVLVMRSGRFCAEFRPPELTPPTLLTEMLQEDGGPTAGADSIPSEQGSVVERSVDDAVGIDHPARVDRPSRSGLLWRVRAARPTLLVLALAVVLFLLEASRSNGGFGALNVQSVMNDSLGVGIAAIGETLVLLIGGFDLSAGGIVSLLNVLLATHLTSSGHDQIAWVVIAVLAGAGMGLVNGVSVAFLRLEGIVVTLAMGFVWGGFALLVLSAPGGNVPADFISSLTGLWGNVFPRAVVVLVVVLLLWVLVTRSWLGPRLYAVGSDRRAAVANGISANGTVLSAYMLSGAFYGLAAVFFTAQTAGGDPGLGTPLLLVFFAAAAVGGVRLGGGRGSAIGAVIGAFVLQLIEEVLFSYGASSYLTYIFQAVVLVIAVAITGWSRGRGKRSSRRARPRRQPGGAVMAPEGGSVSNG